MLSAKRKELDDSSSHKKRLFIRRQISKLKMMTVILYSFYKSKNSHLENYLNLAN